MRIVIKISILLLSLTFLACTEVEKSASQAFGNANSVLKTGREKAFGETQPTVTPIPRY